MAGLLTEITEVVTGLGMSGAPTLDDALQSLPTNMVNVGEQTLSAIRQAQLEGSHAEAFAEAWANGRAFFEADDGLRTRVPLSIEWTGEHRLPGFDNLPIDLRVDHVYLVSCKYQSRILSNSSPANLFHRRLAERSVESTRTSWYETVAPDEYDEFYSLVREFIGINALPADHGDMSESHRQLIRDACGGVWPSELLAPWAQLSAAVARESARRWTLNVDTTARREEMLWRLLRLGPAPYFVLGSSTVGTAKQREPMRLRVGTPWDWKQNFSLDTFVIEPIEAGQPLVQWSARLVEVATGRRRKVTGHVEIRWAHGRFSTVEAKVYLDTPHQQVPGYFPLDPQTNQAGSDGEFTFEDYDDDYESEQLSLWQSVDPL